MNKKYYTDENRIIFNELLSYSVSISGNLGEKEKEIINWLLDKFYPANENNFGDLFSTNQVSKNDIINKLNSISDENTLFYYVFQFFLIIASGSLTDFKKAKLTDLISTLNLSVEKIYMLMDIFINDQVENKNNLLLIGNNSLRDDFVISKYDISGMIISLGNDYFIFFKNLSIGNISNLITINKQLAFDSILYPIDDSVIIEIENKIIDMMDIKNRLKLKNNYGSHVYSVVKNNDDNDNIFQLIYGEKSNSLGFIRFDGCRVIVENIPSSNSLTVYNSQSKQCSLDDIIYINKVYKVSLSKNISRIIEEKPIIPEHVHYEIILIGTDEKSNIYLDDLGDNVIEIMLEKKEYNVWELFPIIYSGELFLNGQPFETKVLLKSGDVLKIDNNYIFFDPVNGIVSFSRVMITSIEFRELTYYHPNGKIGINDISFSNKSGDFCCIMGPSGAGKSTLIKILANLNQSDKLDNIFCNDMSFKKHFSNFKNYIAYVSQDDVLFENLTVYENLFHYGKLKNPDMKNEDISIKIDEILTKINLTDKKNETVGSISKRILSGGERKRLNIALELLSETDILILDEPTSGLSSYDSEKIIELLSDLSRIGKIIYVVIHQPSREVFLMFSHLLLLDRGGNLSYFGDTQDAFYYFSKYAINNKYPKTPDDILSILEQVRKTPDGKTIYEGGVRKKTALRMRTPEQRNKDFKLYQKTYENKECRGINKVLPAKKEFTIANKLNQFVHLLLRNLKNKFKDKKFFVFSFLLPSFLSLISYILKYGADNYSLKDNIHLPKFLFLTSIIIIFLSISNAISEIINDRVVIEKEKMIGYSFISYYMSKLISLSIVNVYQIFIYINISFIILKIPILGSLYFYIKFLFFTIISSISISAFGLFLSSIIKTEKQAFLIIPIFMIPQIVLGGLFINFNDVRMSVERGRPVPEICDMIHSRWIFESYLNLFQQHSIYNTEINSTFINYNLIETSEQNKGDTNNKKVTPAVTVFNRKVKLLKANNRDISFFVKNNRYLTGNINIFPSNEKIFFYIVYPTFIYNLIVILFFTLIYSAGAVIKLKYF